MRCQSAENNLKKKNQVKFVFHGKIYERTERVLYTGESLRQWHCTTFCYICRQRRLAV